METLPEKLVLFNGGNDSQREHLNKVVEAVNDLIDAVDELQEKLGSDPVVFAFVENGELVDYELQSALRITE